MDLQVKIFTETKTGEVLFHEETTTANISSGGAFILTDHKFPLADTVRLEFFLAFEDLEKLRFILSVASLREVYKGKHVWVKATGVVIRTEEKGVGIIFDTDYQVSPMQPSESRDPSPAP